MMKKISSILFVLILMTVVSTSCGKDEPVNPAETFIVNGVTFNMVAIEGGTFTKDLRVIKQTNKQIIDRINQKGLGH